MRKSTDTLSRQWMLLRLIPRQPRKLDTTALRIELQEWGYHSDARTIQRDLQNLSNVFALVCDERSKPYSWSWSREAEGFDLPRMDAHTALTFLMASDFLNPLMPRSTLNHLRPYFERADSVLKGLPRGGLASWPAKVRVIPSGIPLRPPDVSITILEVMYSCLLDEVRAEIDYSKRGASQTKTMVVSPLGLVVRGGVIYLVATAFEYDEAIFLPMQRIKNARATDTPRRVPADFDIDAFIKTGRFGYLFDVQPIKLKAVVHQDLAEILAEAALGPDQELQERQDGEWDLRVTVPNNMQLRGWILGYGSMIHVLEPEDVRSFVTAEVGKAAKRYTG